jgi:hypothetical protein
MPDVLHGLAHTAPIQQPPVVVGYVSTSRPAPKSFDDPVFVLVTNHSAEHVYGPLDWPAIHGQTMPAQGSPIWLAFDDNGTPLVVWWKALYGASSSPDPSPPAPRRGSRALATLLDFDCDPTGVIDATAGINAALAAGSVIATDGIYQVNGVVTVPITPTSSPAFRGTGSGRVTLRLGPGGQIRYGSRSGGAGGPQSGGPFGGFTIDGNKVANVAGGGLYIGLLTSVTFPDLRVQYCRTDNIVIESAQNCTFEGLTSLYSDGSCLVLDYGCGDNSFVGHTELLGGARYNLEIRQSGATIGGFPTTYGPSYNEFLGPNNFEISMGGVNGTTQNLGIVYQGAGTYNKIAGVLTGNPTAGPYSVVVVEQANAGGITAWSIGLTFVNATITDNSNLAVGIEQRGNTSVVLQGRTSFAALSSAFSTFSTDTITVQGDVLYTTVANQWVKAAGSPPALVQNIMGSTEVVQKAWKMSAPTDDIILGYVVSSASTTIAAGSNGVNLNTNPATINVASTVGWPATGGVLYVLISGVPQQILYTGLTPTSFTGCFLGHGAAGVLATGQAVGGGDPNRRVDIGQSGFWVGDGQFDPRGQVGFHYQTFDGGVTKFTDFPGNVLVEGATYVAGSFTHAGTTIGVNGATPVARATITGSRASGAALASLLTFLALRGDIIDSSTP